MSQRKSYTPEFKVKVVLEALQGQKTAAQLCREHSIGEDLLSRWRQELVTRAKDLFATPQQRSAEQERIAELERLVGQLTLELSAVKKVSSVLGFRSPSGGKS